MLEQIFENKIAEQDNAEKTEKEVFIQKIYAQNMPVYTNIKIQCMVCEKNTSLVYSCQRNMFCETECDLPARLSRYVTNRPSRIQ